MHMGGRWLVEAEDKIEYLEMKLVEAGKMNQELREQVTKLKADLNASKWILLRYRYGGLWWSMVMWRGAWLAKLG